VISYLELMEPAYLDLAKQIEKIPNRDGKIKRSAGDKLPEVARSIKHHMLKALPPLLENSRTSTSISLDKNHYSLSFHANFNRFAYNTHIERAFKKLVDAGYISVTTKGWMNRTIQKSNNTKYRLTAKCRDWLIAQLEDIGFDSELYTLVADPALVPHRPNLRAQVRSKAIFDTQVKTTQRLPIERDEQSDLMDAQLTRINGLLAKSWIDLDITEVQRQELDQRLKNRRKKDQTDFISYNKRTLYRVFNDSELQTNGRFYGGWWQSIPNKHTEGTQFRRHIVIDGKPTVEVDYSGLHPAILYAKQGLELNTDPYTPILGRKYRDISKRIFNALINSKTDMKSAPRKLRFKYDDQQLSWLQIKKKIYDNHPDIRNHFCSGAGMWLMKEDSELASQVMDHFASIGVVCLPVHDSFLVHHGYEEELKSKMLECFERRYGVRPKLKFEEPVFSRYEGACSEHPTFDEILDKLEHPQDRRLEMHRHLHRSEQH